MAADSIARAPGLFKFSRAMLSPSSSDLSSASGISHQVKPSRAVLLLWIFWGLLVLRVGIAVVRGESFQGDLALPALGLFVSSAVLGSRVYARIAQPKSTENAEG
jgi:hypothetical protein